MTDLLFLFLKDLCAEKDHVHHSKEKDENDQRQNLISRRKGRKKHHGESKNNGGEILIDHVVGCGGLELRIQLTKQE